MLFLEVAGQNNEKSEEAADSKKDIGNMEIANPYENDHLSLDSLPSLVYEDLESVWLCLDAKQIAIINSQTRALLSEHIADPATAPYRPSLTCIADYTEDDGHAIESTYWNIPLVGKSGKTHNFYVGDDDTIRLADHPDVPRIICPALAQELLAIRDDHVSRLQSIEEKANKPKKSRPVRKRYDQRVRQPRFYFPA
jgi:hypothetical protein